MRAVQLVETGRPLQDREIARPDPGPQEVRVRVVAAGICHSDAHYRRGGPRLGRLPQTLGHEVAGIIDALGAEVRGPGLGDRVCLHYLVTCGDCARCRRGEEQFCPRAEMIGKDRDGGFAEFIVVPARNAIRIPNGLAFDHAALMMCSSATAWHALVKGRLAAGERLLVFGIGGLGVSALQLARVFGAAEVYAVDRVPAKLALAERMGAIAVNAAEEDPIEALARRGAGGVDVALDFVGTPATLAAAVKCLAPRGRAVFVGIGDQPFAVDPYRDILAKEAEIIGCSDHLHGELETLLALAARGGLDLSLALDRRLPLEAAAINAALDALEAGTETVRSVIQVGQG
ncbi:MAG: alcohol dehydrogenase catalytic domain-containing protein [Chloroflexi bacterium]|nr:alcohol dehydrogenase catalytic domain-containing protein [Chloroflexota bacterium]